MRILVSDTIQLGDRDYPEVTIDYREGIERDELLSIIGEYDALITRSRTMVDSELIAAAPNLKVSGRGGVGIDNIDLEAASRRGIMVQNAPETSKCPDAGRTLARQLAS